MIMRFFSPLLALVLLGNAFKVEADAPTLADSLPSLKSAAIPTRPEKLTFPPLKFQPPIAADYRVELKSGPVAYLVPDHELPLVNITIYVRTGEYLEPEGKEGLAQLTGYLLARGGTKSKTAEQLEERLAFLAAQLESDIGDIPVSGGGSINLGSVSLNLLSKDLDEGLSILREILTTPRFQDDKLALRKQQLLQEMQQRNDDSSAIEARESGFLAYGKNFWVNHYPTAKSVEAITRQDLESFHQKWFCPSNFVIAINGDFDRETMITKLEQSFGNWPFKGEVPPTMPTNTTFAAAGVYLVDKPDVNQGRVSMMLPGITRENPDYFDVLVMNYILGGGGLTSRIMNHVRTDEGLAYSAGSRFAGGAYYPLTFTGLFQSKSRTVAYAASIVIDEMKKIATFPVSDDELNTAKRTYIEMFPNTFSTKAQTAAIFAVEEFTGRYARNPDYYKNFRARVGDVKKEDVQRVALKYLTPEKLVILVVGNKHDILLGYPDHPVKLADLSGGKVTNLPLRDPLTMQPMTTK